MKRTKTSLLKSALALLLCVSMLIGSTFAWFTDSVTSKGNVIQSGNLDIEMYWTDDLSSNVWYNVEDAARNTIFSYDNWEPGYTDVKYIKLVNNGSLALNYKLTLTPQGAVGKLAEVINVFFADHAVEVQSREDLSKLGAIGLLNNVLNGGATANGTLLAKDQQSPLHPSGEVIMTIAMNMITTAGNDYQNKDSGEFTITALATQASFEEDSFGSDYDGNVEYPTIITGGTVTKQVNAVDGKVPAGGVTLTGNGISAFVPGGIQMADGADALTLSVTPMEHTTSDITVVNNEILIPVDVHISGIAAGNTTPIVIDLGEVLPKYMNMGNYHLYHVENGGNSVMTLVNNEADLTQHNRFTYDPLTGAVKVAMASFSEVALVADTTNPWKGEADYDWYTNEAKDAKDFKIANADQLYAFAKIVGGMNGEDAYDFDDATVTLLADINLNGGKAIVEEKTKVFYPIGYYNNTDNIYDRDDVVEPVTGVTSNVSSFSGTFDGNGHTIANFYQNTWEMFGDYNDGYSGTPNYYKDAMGLFGYVLNGTVKNLTVDNFSSDGEFTPTGVIAAYACNSTFENIAITNCNPRVYNTGNGGIIGIAGRENEATEAITLRNITVDNSNKISALWGSYDVACGGLVGMFRGNVDESKDTISFENCHVSAIIDVYNDVCGNYQYYAYRYAGMIIGSVRHNTTNTEGKVVPNMAGISASDCTVNYGDWNDYYYCEFVKNGHPSYSGPDDYKFSRVPHSELNFTDSNGNGFVDADERDSVIGCKHNHTAAENNKAIYLPFHQLFTGYSWGVSSIGLENWQGVQVLGITAGDQEESVEKFETKFTGDFLYRVGNKGTVSVGTLFDVKDEFNENSNSQIKVNKNSSVYVTITKVDENSNVSGTFTPNATDWANGIIQFSGTGVVKITIQDYNFCTPTELIVEVVDATNATTATSATSNNVVLLNNISGTFTVSNGYTFYGNGFTVTLPTTSVQEVGSGFTGYISIGASQDDGIANGGHLDNVRIEGPVYPEMYIYRDQAKITDSSDADYGNGNNMRYFRNSVIVYGGNCTISNSYISGSRTALCLRGGNNVVIENTTLSGGAYANMQICAGSNVTLRDVTTVQVDVADSYGKGKTARGLGIAVDSSVVDIYVEGELKQYNWLNQTQWNSIVPSEYQSVFPKFFTGNSFSKYWHYLNGGTDPYVNLAFIFACNWDTSKINDNRTTVDYGTTDATIAGVAGGVYSKVNTVGGNAIADANLKDPGYTAPGFNPIAPSLRFDNTVNNDADDANDANDTYCVYDEGNGTLKIGVSGDSKTLDLSGVTVTKNGTAITHTAYLNDTQISGNSVTIKAADGAKQTLTFKASSNDAGYDKDGKPIAGSIEYTWNITVEIAVLSYPAPVWNMGGDYQFDTSNCVYAYYSTSQGYGEAVPIYEGIKVNYYNKSGTLVNLDLSGTTTLPTGSANSNSNAFTYTLADGSTLTMKFSSGWKSGATTHQFTTYNNKVYIYPQSLDNDNYVRAKTTNQDFDVKITYTFTDPNGQSTAPQTMQWYNAKASNDSVSTKQWKTFDSTNGKNAPSICVTPDTLVTMADGTQKRIDQVTYSDQLLVWDFYKGEYAAMPSSIIMNHGYDRYDVVTLTFDDGTVVNTINGHGFYDAQENQFVILSKANAEQYIGHTFVKDAAKKTTAKLVSYSVKSEYTESWSILTAVNYNCVLEGMLTLTPAEVEGSPAYLMPYEIGEGMKYDEAKMQADIEKYGLYTYADFAEYCTYEQFIGFGFEHFKVSVAKGYITWDEIRYLLSIHLG
ncbi:MAG: hypothetical protein IJA47_02915 [Oscillospiraceae bacterium]|nr:hypothetical protein [Oscillospiraceae bacterium]